LKGFIVPYQVGSNCFPDAPSALVSWGAKFPFVTGTPPTLTWLTSSSANATGLVTYVTSYRSLSTATVTVSASSTVQLPTCVQDLQNFVLDKYPTQDIVFAAALGIAVLIGFVSGRMR
jgi:hypothetical protein